MMRVRNTAGIVADPRKLQPSVQVHSRNHEGAGTGFTKTARQSVEAVRQRPLVTPAVNVNRELTWISSWANADQRCIISAGALATWIYPALG